jgi:GDP/UDP-N,N'-diacetylbacillosamine 2-epimerase (hydrolysing)
VKKICVITGTRAEYGLLRWLMDGIARSARLDLQVIATGAHLAPEFGLTFREIESDGFRIDRKVEMLLSSDTSTGITKSIGVAMIGFADALAELAPDMVLLLGDRYEIFAAAAAATIARIPVAHLHGGETTEGAFDEAMRHSITKMAQLHFVAADEYRRRVVQLGEDPTRVFLVGGLGIDNMLKLDLLDRPALEAALDFRLAERNLLVTFHPATLDQGSATAQMEELLAALDTLENTHLIFTLPNADTQGRVLGQMVEAYVAQRPNARAYASLGQLRYLSAVAQVDAVVGNSSSGLAEVPSFHKATINIGDRQKGRLKAASVIDCEPQRESIKAALAMAYSTEFQAILRETCNPYGEGGASEKVLRILENYDFSSSLKKMFHDLPDIHVAVKV